MNLIRSADVCSAEMRMSMLTGGGMIENHSGWKHTKRKQTRKAQFHLDEQIFNPVERRKCIRSAESFPSGTAEKPEKWRILKKINKINKKKFPFQKKKNSEISCAEENPQCGRDTCTNTVATWLNETQQSDVNDANDANDVQGLRTTSRGGGGVAYDSFVIFQDSFGIFSGFFFQNSFRVLSGFLKDSLRILSGFFYDSFESI